MEQETKTCVGCKHFVQHYTRTGNHRYTAIDCGHCINPRLRDKKPETPACQRFAKR